MLEQWPRSEVEIARAFVSWLEDQRWTVYQEVQVARYGAIADLVGVRDGLVWVIETKRSLTLDLLAQAIGWSYRAHYVSIGVPRARRRGATAVRAVCEQYRIGLCLASLDYDKPTIVEDIPPRLHRKAKADQILGALVDQQKSYAEAGNADGQRWTPFRETCDQVARFVRAHDGCILKDCIDSIRHHYRGSATARSALRKWIDLGLIRGVRAVKEKGRIRLYRDEAAGA